MKITNKGETIVGVLISAAIIGLVLVSSYTIIRRSFTAGQATRERTKVLKVIETQLERLKYAIYTGVSSIDPFDQTSFCVDADGQVQPGSTDITVCDVGDIADNPDRNFIIKITYDENGLNDDVSTYDDNLFVITATWLEFGKSTPSVIKIFYRIHPARVGSSQLLATANLLNVRSGERTV